MCNCNNSKVSRSIQLLDKQTLLCNHMPVSYSNIIAQLLGILPSHQQRDCFCHHCTCLCHRCKGTTARPNPCQAVTNFVAYLDRLKDELPLYNNKACLQHLKTKLQPKITNKMIAWPNLPKTCQEAINLAVWLEQVEPSCKPKTTTPRQSNAFMRLRGRGFRHGNYFYWQPQDNGREISSANQTPWNVIVTNNKKERRRWENFCFYCDRLGHSIAECCEKKSKELGKRQPQ